MKTINKMILAFIAIVVTMVILIGYIAGNVSLAIDEEKAKYEIYIGESYILEKDTLTIIDYSSLNETFILSNGVEINYNLVNKK